MKQKCVKDLHSFYGHCDRPATVFVDGKGFCWQHDPARLRAKAELRKQEQRERDARFEFEWDRKQLERRAGLRDLTDTDLDFIVSAGGIKAMIARAKESTHDAR